MTQYWESNINRIKYMEELLIRADMKEYFTGEKFFKILPESMCERFRELIMPKLKKVVERRESEFKKNGFQFLSKTSVNFEQERRSLPNIKLQKEFDDEFTTFCKNFNYWFRQISLLDLEYIKYNSTKMIIHQLTGNQTKEQLLYTLLNNNSALVVEALDEVLDQEPFLSTNLDLIVNTKVYMPYLKTYALGVASLLFRVQQMNIGKPIVAMIIENYNDENPKFSFGVNRSSNGDDTYHAEQDACNLNPEAKKEKSMIISSAEPCGSCAARICRRFMHVAYLVKDPKQHVNAQTQYILERMPLPHDIGSIFFYKQFESLPKIEEIAKIFDRQEFKESFQNLHEQFQACTDPMSTKLREKIAEFLSELSLNTTKTPTYSTIDDSPKNLEELLQIKEKAQQELQQQVKMLEKDIAKENSHVEKLLNRIRILEGFDMIKWGFILGLGILLAISLKK